MMAATIPSGCPKVVLIRNKLIAALFGPGHAQEFRKGRPFEAPTIVHELGESAPDAARVCVGWGNCSTTLTPWSCPLLPVEYTAVEAVLFVHTRMDAEDWLARLSGKVLVCNCKLDAGSCWAHILQDACREMFDTAEHELSSVTFAVAESDHEQPDALLFEEYIKVPDTFRIKQSHESSIPEPVPWPPAWTTMVAVIRSLERPVAWGNFSGMAELTKAFSAMGVSVAPPIDAAENADYDLLNASFLAVVLGVLASGIVDFVHLAPPCSTFSIALNGCSATRVRSWEEPSGIKGLNKRQQYKVSVGNALAEAAATIMAVQHKAGNLFQLEQPAESIMMAYKPMEEALRATESRGYQRDACADGAPWRKPLVLYTPTRRVGQSLVAGCPGCKSHIKLRGKASPYWPE